MKNAIAFLVICLCAADAFADASAAAKFRAKDVHIDDTLQVGATAPEAATQKVVFSALDTTTRVMQTITSAGHTNHNSGGGSNQISNLWLQATGGFNTTTLNGVNRALEIVAACSVTSGPGSCEDFGVISNAANGYSWFSETGTMQQQGQVQFGPGAVSLGSNVSPFSMPGTSGTATQFHIGWATPPGNVFSGVSMAVKNAQPSVTFGGYGVALDTSVSGASGVRGGYIMSRGANGGLVSGLSSGMVFSGGTGFPFTDSAANEMAIYDELGQGIAFGANTSTFGKAFKLTPKDHLVALGVTPSLNAGCTSGGGQSISGADIAFKLTTGASSTACTVTFANTWTVAPVCTVTREGSTTVPTFTTSATTLVMSVNASSATYNVNCWGVTSSATMTSNPYAFFTVERAWWAPLVVQPIDVKTLLLLLMAIKLFWRDAVNVIGSILGLR